MRRHRATESLDERRDRSRPRWTQTAADEDESGQEQAVPESVARDGLPAALLSLCGRFGLEPWAGERDDRGLWAFGLLLADWLEKAGDSADAGAELELGTIRLLTNLFIILGAVIRPPAEVPADAPERSAAAVAAARRRLALRYELLPPFPGAARAVRRLVRVRGWNKLSQDQQAIAESLLALYLETLAATLHEPSPATLLTAAEAWLTVIHVQGLPRGFDEHLLRATCWYLETYAVTAAPRPLKPSRAR
jgi:hypothetical protein